MATIFITHDLALAGQRSARIVVMHAGHVVENAPTAELFAHPRHPYTAELIAATPDSAASLDELASIPGSLPDLRRTDLPPCRYSERCPRKIDACAQPLPRSGCGCRAYRRLLESAARAHCERANGECGMTVLLDVADVSKLFPVGSGPGPLGAAEAALFRRPGEIAEGVRRRRRELRHRQGRDGRSGRRIRLRQVDPGARAHAPDRRQRRQHQARRRANCRASRRASSPAIAIARASRWCSRTPAKASIRASPRFDAIADPLRRLRKLRGKALTRTRRDRGRAMRAAAAIADALSASAFRRPARPRRHCPRHRGRARTSGARRADRGARRFGSGGDPSAAAAAQERDRHELSVRVARS